MTMKLISTGSADAREWLEFTVDGDPVGARPGQTVAAAMLVAGRNGLRRSVRLNEERGYYCGMGVCWECAVWVVGRGTVRACRTPVTPGMVVRRLPSRSAD